MRYSLFDLKEDKSSFIEGLQTAINYIADNQKRTDVDISKLELAVSKLENDFSKLEARLARVESYFFGNDYESRADELVLNDGLDQFRTDDFNCDEFEETDMSNGSIRCFLKRRARRNKRGVSNE